MKALLFIFLFLFIQEPVKKEAKRVEAPKLNIDSSFKMQNMKLDSIIATKNAEIRYNAPDTAKIKNK